MMLLNITDLLIKINCGQVVVYPTESVFGLGCNPDNIDAIRTLLKIKRRSWKKGLILIAANYTQLLKYIDDSYLNNRQRLRIFSSWPGHVTWVFPARMGTSSWLTGRFSSIAVRISNFDPVRNLCLSFGKPLVSTSANISGYPPARTIMEIHRYLGYHNLPVMHESVLGLSKPSEIRDAITGKIIRK